LTYIAGFDILYACQDIDFDKKEGLFSLPSIMGAEKAMKISAVLHGTSFLFLSAMYPGFGMHPVFLIFLAVIGVLLVIEHYLVRPDDLTHIHTAFFHINSLVSVLLFTGVLSQGLFK
jgi:4-hydroxybenzoate polyprenyltransferase